MDQSKFLCIPIPLRGTALESTQYLEDSVFGWKKPKNGFLLKVTYRLVF